MSYQTDLPCVICGKQTEGGNCFHHLMSRKSHPEFKDDPRNMIPVCFLCHTEIFHKLTLVEVADKYQSVKEFLLNNNWQIILNKWRLIK